MHGMHSIFQPQRVTGHGAGGNPILEKKLKQLEGLQEHVKEILLPLACQKRRSQQFSHQEDPAQLFKKIVFTLHHASMGIPGGRGIFTAMWAAIKSWRNGAKATRCLQHHH